MRNLTIIIVVLTSYWSSYSQITIDENFSDWSISQLVSADLNDNSVGIDITNLHISNDENFLYLKFSVNTEILLQDENALAIYIDADNNINTGFLVENVGAEISFYFGDRNGFVNYPSGFSNVIHADIGLLTAPTVSSDEFEIAIQRKFEVDNQIIELDETIAIVLENDIPNGDKIPNNNSSILYSIDEEQISVPDEYSISKAPDTDFRLLNYNVLFDELFNPNLAPSYRRVLQAIDPDIIAFQEIYDHSAAQTRSLVEEFLPSISDEQWFSEKVGSDLVLVSRYPIVFEDFVVGNGAFIVDVDGQDVLIINVHLPCCDNNSARQNEIDGILRYLREIQDGQAYPLAQNAPIIIAGDFNLVGPRSQIESLLTGDIINNNNYGPDFIPDWNKGDLSDLNPIVTGLPASYTWYNPQSSFFPGRLDYVLYSGSSLFKTNAYVLNTTTLNQGDLSQNNLSQLDTDLNSDHLPMVSDWSFDEIISDTYTIEEDIDIQLSPNPVTDLLHITTSSEILSIELFSLNGQLVFKSPFTNTINLEHLTDQSYFIVLKAASGNFYSKLLIKR